MKYLEFLMKTVAAGGVLALSACGGGDDPAPPPPQELSFTQIAATSNSGVRFATTQSANTDAAWQLLWAQYSASVSHPPPAPDVNFASQSVAAIFLGQVTDCTRPVVQSVAITTSASVRVSYRVEGLGPTALCAAVVATPAQVVGFTNTARLPIEFSRVN